MPRHSINNAYGMELEGVIHREYESIVEDIYKMTVMSIITIQLIAKGSTSHVCLIQHAHVRTISTMSM